MKKDRMTHIYEFVDEHIYAVAIKTDCRYFLIVNPPQTTQEIKELVEDFTIEYIMANPDVLNIPEDGCFHWVFLRNSKHINENWTRDEGYFSVDRIEDHFDDLIASVFWDFGDDALSCRVRLRSKHWRNYGEILNEETFLKDRQL